ncbi:MAG: hypothetical protein AAGM67_04620, partial [Bacteroidota bacterium]
MDLRETWNELQQQSFELNIIEDDSLESMIHQQSASPMEMLRKQVFKKMMFILGFVILFLITMPFIEEFLVQILLLILTLAYVIGGVVLWQEYKMLKEDPPMEHNLLDGLRSYRD